MRRPSVKRHARGKTDEPISPEAVRTVNDSELASHLRIEERVLEAGGLN